MLEQERCLEITYKIHDFYRLANEQEDILQFNFNSRVKKIYIDKYILTDCTLIDNCNRLKLFLEEDINRLILFYKKDELMYAMMVLKEYLTKHSTKTNSHMKHYITEQAVINLVLYFTINLPNYKFKNNPFEMLDFERDITLSLFGTIRGYIFFCENFEIVKHMNIDNITLEQVVFDTIETKEFDKYYKEFENLAKNERAVDYKFINEGIAIKQERDGKSLNQIYNESSNIIQRAFGFKIESLNMISSLMLNSCFKDKYEFLKYIEDDEVFFPAIALNVDKFKSLFSDVLGQNELNNIIKTFKIEDIPDYRQVELSCFMIEDNQIIFGLIDMSQVFEMFKKMTLSGAYLDRWNIGYNLENMLDKSQKKISTYICYTMADMLESQGYCMHMEKFKYNNKQYIVPTVEESNIIIAGKNVADTVGDYDLLFLDNYKSQIIIVEFKYFKPSVTIQQLVKSDKNKVIKQILGKDFNAQKIMNREKVIRENIEFFVSYLGGIKGRTYSVKTIVVTTTPNLYVYSEEVVDNKMGITFYSINDFNEAIKKHNI